MKKFFKFGKEKKTPTPQSSPKIDHLGRSLALQTGVHAGYDIREKDLGKLHKAAWIGDLDKVKQLAKKDASPLDKENRTPLHLASARGYPSIVQELLEWKAKTTVGDNMSCTPLIKAVECKQDECVKLLLEHKADPNAKDTNGDSSLHYATRDGSHTIVQIFLCSDKIFPDIKNKEGQTPLHLAVNKRNMNITQLLLQHGADINAMDSNGRTPLMEASFDGATDIVKFLLENRADINLKDNKGWTADDIATIETQEDVLKALIQYGRSMGTKVGVNMVMDTTDAKKANRGEMNSSSTVYGEQEVDDQDEEVEDTAHVMLSARSDMSQQSGWSDDESLFSSVHDNMKKPSLVKLQHDEFSMKTSLSKQTSLEKPQLEDESEADSWNDADESLLSSVRGEKSTAISSSHLPSVQEEQNNMDKQTKIQMEFFNSSADEDLDNPSATSTQNVSTKQNNHLPAELGVISDVEDVSDPDFDDSNTPRTVASVDKALDDGHNDSDWDSTIESDHPRLKEKLYSKADVIEDIMDNENETITIIEDKDEKEKNPTLVMTEAQQNTKLDEPGIATHTHTLETSTNHQVQHEVDNYDDDDDDDEIPNIQQQGHDFDDSIDDEVDGDENIGVDDEGDDSSGDDNDDDDDDADDADDADDDDDDDDVDVDIPTPPIEIKPRFEDKGIRHMAMEKCSPSVKADKKEDHGSSWRDEHDEQSQRLCEQREAIDKELLHVKARYIQHSFDEEDTFHDVPEMDSPRKTDFTVLGGPPPSGGMNDIQDDDCLSYSSTEHEASVHEDHRSHQLMPVSLSLASDSTNVMRLQQQMRECQQKLEKERSARLSLENKRKSVDKDREELIQKLEDVSRAKSQLEQNKIDIEASIRNFQYQLNEETEKRKNFEVLYNKTKDQLSRKDDQYTLEVELKQKSDLSLRNLQMELCTAQAAVKQFEEEKEDFQRQLSHERNARLLQEQINEEQVKFQHTISDNLNNSDSKAENISPMDAMDEKKMQAYDTIEKVKADLYATKVELERVRSLSKDDHDIMSTENDELHQKIDELKRDIKINEEALAHASLKYNLDLTSLSAENTKLVSRLDGEKTTREKLEYEVESLKTRLETTSSELTKAQNARNELERCAYSKEEDLTREVQRKDQELIHIEQNNQTLQQRLDNSDSKVNKTENELHIANATLIERTNQLSTMQRELEHRRSNQDTLDTNYRKEKEDHARLEAKHEALQERVTSLQLEAVNLRQQLDEANVRTASEGKEEGDKFSLILTTLREDHDKQRISLENRNTSLLEQMNSIKDELHVGTSQRVSLEQQVCQLQEQLAEASRQKTLSQASLDVTTKAKEQFQLEQVHLKIDIDNLQSKLDLSREKQLESQSKVIELKEKLSKAETTQAAASQQLMSQSNHLESTSKSKSELEDNLHKLGLEKANLESQLQNERQRIEMLQREVDEAQKDRRKSRKALDIKKTADSKFSEEQNRISELQQEVTLLKTHLKAAKKRLKELDTSDNRIKALHANFDQEKEHERNLSALKRQLNDVRNQLDSEITVKGQLEGKTRQLQVELSTLRGMEKSYGKLDKVKRKLEEELTSYRTHIDNSFVERTEVEKMKAELEAKARMELNRKLEEVNIYLEEQARARDKLDHMRDTNEDEMKREFDRTRNELMEDVNKIQTNYKELLMQKEVGSDEAKRFKSMYETELQTREQMSNRLEKALHVNDRAQTLIDRQRTSGSIYGPMENGWTSSLMKPSTNHGTNDVFTSNIRHELDRSISKHLEKGPHVDMGAPSRSMDDTVTSSSLNKSRSDYMTVLKKNYLL